MPRLIAGGHPATMMLLLPPNLLVGQREQELVLGFVLHPKGNAGVPFGINKHKGWSWERQPAYAMIVSGIQCTHNKMYMLELLS